MQAMLDPLKWKCWASAGGRVLGQKQTLALVRPMSALPPKADIGWNALACPLSAKQLCDIRRDPPRLIFDEQFGGRSPALFFTI
jgi:hypothetical protein